MTPALAEAPTRSLTMSSDGGAKAALPAEYRWTTSQFYRMAEAGVFSNGSRLELIRGRILKLMPSSPLHTSLMNIIAETLRVVCPSGCAVRSESAVHLNEETEPIPDISVVRGSNRDYLRHHPEPSDILWVVEVAVSSEVYDLGEKARLYAESGIPEYWVVVPERHRVVIHHGPTPEGYQRVISLGPNETITPLAAPEAVLTVRSLLGDLEEGV